MKSAFWKSCAVTSALVLALSVSHLANAQVHEQSAHHGFHDIEHWAQAFESPERAKWQRPDEVVHALNLKPGETIADIGAGTGYFTRRFAAAVGPTGTVIGVDIEPAMVDYMKADAKKLKLANYEARLSKPDDAELAPHSVDLIFFCDVLHHVDNRLSYLRKLKPALKPGARVVVIDFKKEALPVGPPPADKISREDMIGEFRAAGYRLVREHRFLPYQYFLEFEPGPRA
jgi:ubiquinone/menaquinone biosynthesis C-methylase UbiE